ncbi:MAG: hypothetical protein EAZ71_00210 [Verrucomicrobia bacterium]|nr:MAG: hypothetical protein EAZ71_00210 [Verrucomicrobiota bacterium]
MLPKTSMKPQSIRLKIAAIACGLSCVALAGEPNTESAMIEESSWLDDFDFCSWLSSKPGTVYKDPSNPWIGEVQLFGRYHWQAAYIDGEGTNGGDFSESYTDARRFRLGAKIGFLNYLSYKGAVNLVDDQRFNGKDLDYGYQDFDESVVTFDAQRALNVSNLDVLTLNYGRIKWHGGLEARASSNELLTVERSAIANKLYNSYRPTGITVNAVKGSLNTLVGIYSSDEATGAKVGADGTTPCCTTRKSSTQQLRTSAWDGNFSTTTRMKSVRTRTPCSITAGHPPFPPNTPSATAA